MRPSTKPWVELGDEMASRGWLVRLHHLPDMPEEGVPILAGWLDAQLPRLLAEVLSQEIEAVRNRSAGGFRRRQFQSARAETRRHQWFDLVFQECVCTPCHEEVVTGADQMHFGALGTFGVRWVVGFEQLFQAVQSQIGKHR